MLEHKQNSLMPRALGGLCFPPRLLSFFAVSVEELGDVEPFRWDPTWDRARASVVSKPPKGHRYDKKIMER